MTLVMYHPRMDEIGIWIPGKQNWEPNEVVWSTIEYGIEMGWIVIGAL